MTSLKWKIVKAAWLEEDGRRLDCNPYMSGALEARDALKQLSCRKDRLRDVTLGMFDSGRESRQWVDDSRYGIRYMGSSAIGLSDLSNLPLISSKQVARNSKLVLEEGWSLITRSGTIGRMAYVRPDMAGLACSEDVLRVVPNAEKIPPGYLFAYLSSSYGVPLVVSGTYGAIIQHIEPKHIEDLPVPRLGDEFERLIHDKVSAAAEKLSNSQFLLNEASSQLFLKAGVPNPSSSDWNRDKSDKGFSVNSSELGSLRAWNHSRRVQAITDVIESGDFSVLSDLIDLDWIRWRVMFKRIDADQENGIEVLSQKPLFSLFPEGRWISRKYLLNHSPRYVVPDRTIIVAKQGTLGEDELFCRCEFITGGRALSRAYTDHCMRIVARKGEIEPGYLYAFLRSNAGFRILRGLSEGSKQQDLHWRTVPLIPVPRLPSHEEERIARMVYDAYSERNSAIDLMIEARNVLEKRISMGE
ncbi:hypothetical protein RVS30_004280 [Pseudomonas aeruginosa]|nr:hypothetical protein [Pseudomonas aeruginosa]